MGEWSGFKCFLKWENGQDLNVFLKLENGGDCAFVQQSRGEWGKKPFRGIVG